MNLVRISRDHKGSLRYLEPVLDRIRAMSRRFNGDPDIMVTDVWDCLSKRSQALGLWAGVEADDTLGHLLMFIRIHDGQWAGWISQCEVDTPVSRGVKDQVVGAMADFVDQWNLAYGKSPHNALVTKFRMCTPRSEEAWGRYLGFTHYRNEMERSVHPRSP